MVRMTVSSSPNSPLKGPENRAPTSGIRRYIKWVSVLTLIVVVVAGGTVFIAYRSMGAEFDTDLLTENDIPLAIGGAAAGAGVGIALLSVFSPVSFIKGDGVGGILMDEIELPEREAKKKDKKAQDKNASAAENRRRQAADEKMRKNNREKARKRNTQKNKTKIAQKRRRLKANKRLKGLRRAPKGLRFLRGFFRLLFKR